MVFADDVIIIDENTDCIEGEFERHREVLEKNGLKIHSVKTKLLGFGFKNWAQGNGSNYNVRLEG